MKVAYVLKVFPRLSETFILNEILALEAQGVEVEIFSLNPPNDSRFHGALSRLKAEVTYLPRAESSEMWRAVRSACAGVDMSADPTGWAFLEALRRKDADGLRLFLQSLWLAAALRKRGVQHMHAHFATSATAAAMMAGALTAIPFSFTAHAKDIYHEELDRALVVNAIERAAFVVTVTDYNVRRLMEFSPAARDKVRRIYNGVPLDLLQPSAEPAPAPVRIVSVGRLVEKKGFPDLVDACRILKDQGREFRCSIIGGGPLEPQLRAMVERFGLGDFVLLEGARPQDVVLEAIRASHVMALPCIVGDDGNRDALPTVLLEAMALGRPAVSTDLEGVTEIVDHGETGLLVAQRNSAALADALGILMASPELRTAYGRNARAKAERLFSLHRNVRRLAELYRASAAAEPAFAGGLRQCA